MTDYLRVGVIIKPHALKGEVKVYPTTDDINRMKKLKKVRITNGKISHDLNVSSVKIFKNQAIISFKEYSNINDIMDFMKWDILVEKTDAVPLEDDEYFLDDLIGIKVISDENEDLGEISDIIQTAANDVYVVSMQGVEDLLIPAIKQCVLDVDLNNKTVTVHILKGLR